ncbi:MAG: YcaO-like family protein [Candidatus Margulisbacteria bacterium]|nr:YcaO-like family protein [Candidatus Margulisiibacteriota bacterium]
MVDFILQENNDGPFDFHSALKTYTYDQDKFIHPQITYAKTYKKVIKTIENTKLITITEELPVFSYDFSNGEITTHGKGVTKEQAKSSAIMEFCERYSWLNFDYKNAPGYLVASFIELAEKDDMSYIEPAFVFHSSEKHKELEAKIKSIPTKWIDGFSLTNNKTVKYPLSWINYIHGSNGICTGNIKEEAIVQGICEIIERNNCNRFVRNYKNEKINIIDNNSIEHDWFKDILTFFKKEKTQLFLLHISTGCNLPVVLAYCINDTFPQSYSKGVGYGCHTNPTKAVLRAITEYFQSRTGIIEKQKNVAFKKISTKHNFIYYLNLDINWIDKNNTRIPINNIKDISDNDFKKEINTLIDITKQYGMEIIIANKKHPKLNVPVYKVFSPQAEPPMNLSPHAHMPEWIIAQMYYEAEMVNESEDFIKKNQNKITDFDDSIFDNFTEPIFGKTISDFAKKTMKTMKMNSNMLCKKNYLLVLSEMASVDKTAEENINKYSKY